MTATTFLAIRAAHVLVAALWIGASVFASALLMPAVDASGRSGGQVLDRLMRRGFDVYMTAVGITTVLSGIYLFWRFTGGFDLSVSTSHAGLVFGIGGVAGVLAGVVGGGVVGRSSKKLRSIVTTSITVADDGVHRALLGEIDALKQRMKFGSQAVVVLQTIALVCMSVGHYV